MSRMFRVCRLSARALALVSMVMSSADPLAAQYPSQTVYVCQTATFWCAFSYAAGAPNGSSCYCNTLFGPVAGRSIDPSGMPNTPTLPKPQPRTPGSEPPRSPGNPKGEVDADDCYKGLGNCPGSFLNASKGHGRAPATPRESDASSSDASDAVDGLENYLSSQVRAADSEHSTPDVNITDCVLAVESEYYVSSRTTVTISQSVALGRVESSSRYDGSDGVMVSIRDYGAGIEEEARGRIFHLYYTTKTDGNGIGLAQAFRAVQLHNGQIAFESQPGHGTTFHIRLKTVMGEG